ncbi:MAG: arginine--tRNA ligase [Prevotella histicola]|jgi:arginine--tRNA ligase|uniref:arginine--tRNA ligase n=1 Tax=Prevotella histicola TaxID=470565 RepID=UPI001C5FAE19|nr:arginine--tRNA ligase [Prevotella histicola]MBF1393514.1 arginine--tRNA ligase [Prevotella histicola]MBS6662685.1 arginine--tRNA ligase [Prevotella histicola]MBW4712245.1 arginine--tRNA ligase [Prevotella histicola]MBW4757527.1 arginine--tRNA ligase [Prevotella histicola]MBW4774252.1 arginine--tRNA ligase [Prevotella histicola]
MKIEDQITSAALAAVKDLYGVEVPEKMIQLQKTRSNFEGNLTLVTFPLLKTSHKKPEDTAQDLGEYLKKNCKAVADFNVVKGFLNLVIAQSAWVGLLNDINGDEKFGEKRVTDDSPLVMIEYSSPNTNKPLHLGHVRNNLLGWSLAQIMEANGNKVVKTNIVNDRGIHICKSMLAWLKWGNGITPEKAGKKGDHLIGDFYVLFDKHFKEECKQLQEQYEKEGMTTDEAKAKAEQEAPLIKEAHEMLVKWENNDPEIRALWEKMNSWVYAGFDETYKALGVGFDKIYYESNTYLVGKKKVEEGLKKGLFIRKDDNSVWADLTNEGLDQKLLLRKDGTSVYMTQDIGTAEMRFNDFPIDKMIYVVGNEQNYHFQVLSILLDRLGFKWGKDLVHFSYGMVELPNGKMKSREGTVVDADDLVASMIENAKTLSEDKVNKLEGITEEEKNEIARIVGMGALKYFILKVDARKNMLFNPEESIDFNGNTGPFIQYTYARIRSILRKAEAQNITLPDTLNDDAPLNEKEIALIQKLNDFSVAVAQAGVDYSPSGIANYCYELTKEFNQFYHDYSILNADSDAEKITRLVLAKNVAKVIKNGMALLGIEVPERM